MTVAAGDETRLDGTASYDPAGSSLAYSWKIASRPADSAAELMGGNTAEPVLTPDKGGDYLVSLVVSNGKRDSRPDTVVLEVTGGGSNLPPTASALCSPAACQVAHGTALATGTSTPFRLNGSNSHDFNGDTLTFTWTQIHNASECTPCLVSHPTFVCNPTVSANATISLDAGNPKIVDIQAPMAAGHMVFRLEVTDTGNLSDSICLDVDTTDNPPLALVDSSTPTTAGIGAQFTLLATTDSDNDTIDYPNLTHTWTYDNTSLVSRGTASSSGDQQPVTVSAATTVTFRLEVSDGILTSGTCAAATCMPDVTSACCIHVVVN